MNEYFHILQLNKIELRNLFVFLQLVRHNVKCLFTLYRFLMLLIN